MTSKRALIGAVRGLLRPVVRLMVALGFNARDFMEVVKIVYAEVGLQNSGGRGRSINISRAAVLTGLTRREVAHLRKVLGTHSFAPENPLVPAERILAAWHEDPQYLDAAGRPRELKLGSSFTALVNQHRCDLPAATLIRELKEHRSIEVQGERVRALSRFFVPFELDSHAIERFGRLMSEFGEAITKSLLSDASERTIFADRIERKLVLAVDSEALRKCMDHHAMEFLEEVEAWLAASTSQRDARISPDTAVPRSAGEID